MSTPETEARPAPILSKIVTAALVAFLTPLIVRYANDWFGTPIDTETASRWAVAVATGALTLFAGWRKREPLKNIQAYLAARQAGRD